MGSEVRVPHQPLAEGPVSMFPGMMDRGGRGRRRGMRKEDVYGGGGEETKGSEEKRSSRDEKALKIKLNGKCARLAVNSGGVSSRGCMIWSGQ